MSRLLTARERAKEERIAYLEAKLAELREQITILDEENSKTFMKSVNAWRENAELKQQLAEKEKEISNLRGLVNERDKQIKNLKTNKKRVIEHKNNVKISFCIEQLEKVKEYWLKHEDVSYYIDNQIEELKKEIK